MTDLRIVPVTFADACQFVTLWHRHHIAPIGHKFSIGVCDNDNTLRGVAMIGRPVARAFDDGLTLEVNRTATDGTQGNGYSNLSDISADGRYAYTVTNSVSHQRKKLNTSLSNMQEAPRE